LIDLNKNGNEDDNNIKLKFKENEFQKNEELETQIKSKIQQLEEEIISLKGKGSYFGWNQDDHNIFIKTYNYVTSKQRNNIDEFCNIIYDKLASTKQTKDIHNHYAKYKL